MDLEQVGERLPLGGDPLRVGSGAHVPERDELPAELLVLVEDQARDVGVAQSAHFGRTCALMVSHPRTSL